jgi:hypothetical protein
MATVSKMEPEAEAQMWMASWGFTGASGATNGAVSGLVEFVNLANARQSLVSFAEDAVEKDSRERQSMISTLGREEGESLPDMAHEWDQKRHLVGSFREWNREFSLTLESCTGHHLEFRIEWDGAADE